MTWWVFTYPTAPGSALRAPSGPSSTSSWPGTTAAALTLASSSAMAPWSAIASVSGSSAAVARSPYVPLRVVIGAAPLDRQNSPRSTSVASTVARSSQRTAPAA